jgi:AcrR family transcriptional regulator
MQKSSQKKPKRVKESTEQRLIRISGELFAEHAYEAVTIRDIAEAAGVNIAAVNYHFGGKEELFAATIRHAFDRVQAPLASNAKDIEAALAEMVYQILSRLFLEDPNAAWQQRLLARAIMHNAALVRAVVDEYTLKDVEALASLLARAKGTITRDVCLAAALGILGECLFVRQSSALYAQLLPGMAKQDTKALKGLAKQIAAQRLKGIVG